MAEKNILVFQMSKFNSGMKNHYYCDYDYIAPDSNATERKRFFFDGISQLEPGTKYIITKLALKGKRLDKIIILNTKETMGYDDDSDKGNKTLTATKQYQGRINEFLGRKNRDDEVDNNANQNSDDKNAAGDNDLDRKIYEYMDDRDKDVLDQYAGNIVENLKRKIRETLEKKERYSFDDLKKMLMGRDGLINIFINELNEVDVNSFKELETDSAYADVEDELISTIDKMDIEGLEKSEEVFLKYKNILWEKGIFDREDAFKKGYRDIWIRYIISKLRYRYTRLYHENLELKEHGSKENRAFLERAKNAEKRAEILDKRLKYIENKVENSIKGFAKDYAYYYCLLNKKFENACEEETVNSIRKTIEELYNANVGKPDGLFVDVLMDSKDYTNTLTKLKNEINSYGTDEDIINIYIDMQGGDRTGIFLINSVLKLTDKRRFRVKEQFATKFDRDNICNEVVDETKTYDVDKLASGMQAFINYGRADDLLEYLESVHGEKGYSEANMGIVECIRKIGDAISICDPVRFDENISELKKLFDSWEVKDTGSASVFPMVVEELKNNFSTLIKEDSNILDEIEWFADKGFIQQALTFIEDKMPQYIYDNLVYYRLVENNRVIRTDQTEKIKNFLSSPDYENRLSNRFVNVSGKKYRDVKNREIREKYKAFFEKRFGEMLGADAQCETEIEFRYFCNAVEQYKWSLEYKKLIDDLYDQIEDDRTSNRTSNRKSNRKANRTSDREYSLYDNYKIGFDTIRRIGGAAYNEADETVNENYRKILEFIEGLKDICVVKNWFYRCYKKECIKWLHISDDSDIYNVDDLEKFWKEYRAELQIIWPKLENKGLVGLYKDIFGEDKFHAAKDYLVEMNKTLKDIEAELKSEQYIDVERYVEYKMLNSNRAIVEVPDNAEELDNYLIEVLNYPSSWFKGNVLYELYNALMVSDISYNDMLRDNSNEACIIKYKGDVACLKATPKNDQIPEDELELLIVLIELHTALKRERNISNHASEKESYRLTEKQLEIIIREYIRIAKSVSNDKE